jgi:hypothetical protein
MISSCMARLALLLPHLVTLEFLGVFKDSCPTVDVGNLLELDRAYSCSYGHKKRIEGAFSRPGERGVGCAGTVIHWLYPDDWLDWPLA